MSDSLWPMDSSSLGSSIQGILQAWILELVIPFSRESSQSRDQTQVSHTAVKFFTIWATREAPTEAVLPEMMSTNLIEFYHYIYSCGRTRIWQCHNHDKKSPLVLSFWLSQSFRNRLMTKYSISCPSIIFQVLWSHLLTVDTRCKISSDLACKRKYICHSPILLFQVIFFT